jgi:hypothetical protein
MDCCAYVDDTHGKLAWCVCVCLRDVLHFSLSGAFSMQRFKERKWELYLFWYGLCLFQSCYITIMFNNASPLVSYRTHTLQNRNPKLVICDISNVFVSDRPLFYSWVNFVLFP